MNEGLGNPFVNTLAASDTYLYIGTEPGVPSQGNILSKTGTHTGASVKFEPILWRRLLPAIATGVKQDKENAPISFALYENYPNPFNPTTTISFSLPSRSFVSLKIFDLLGREVATVISEEMSAGRFSKQWNAAKFSSGIYFCRLTAGGSTQVKKMLLVK
jgi:hypothetical protein